MNDLSMIAASHTGYLSLVVCLILTGCGFTPENARNFRDGLACRMARQQVYDLVKKHDIESFRCNVAPIERSPQYEAFDCWAQEGNVVYELENDSDGRLLSYREGHHMNLTNLKYSDVTEICDRP